MKKQLLAVAVAAALLAPQAVGAEGFAIYEWSAEGVAMGGARMFAENDAANMAYDPASITKIEGEALKVSATYLSPHGKYDLNKYDLNKNAHICGGTESGHNRVHPAWAPGTYYVKQLNEKEWIGMGAYSRFGMASQFERASIAGTNAFSSKLNGLSVGVNYARKLDSKWAASVGAEVNYIGLQLDKNQYLPKNGLSPLKGLSPLHIEGESYALGWNAAANYAFDKKNEMGLVYRSKITHSMEADYDVHNAAIPLALSNGDAYGVVTLPESLSLGYNHKFDDKNRVELNAIWTRWERYDALDISFTGGELNGQPSPNAKNWSNSKRLAVGYEHKFSDKYSGMLGYAFDKSAIPYDGGDFMIPTGNRTTYSLGTQYHDKKQTLAVALAWMNVGSLDFAGGVFINGAHTRDSYTKIASISYQRNF